MKDEQYNLENRKDYPIIFEKLKNIEEFVNKQESQWSFLGFNSKDFKKIIFYLFVGAIWGSNFYNKVNENMEVTKHLVECNDNRDRWSTAKYGHPFECGKPTDNWSPTFGNLKP